MTPRNVVQDAVFDWLADGEVGISSKAIALTAARGATYRRKELLGDHPHDPDDLRRCVLLLDRIPQARELAFPVLVQRCPYWAALIPQWDRLVGMLHEELAEWTGLAPRTYAAMRALIDPIQEEQKRHRTGDTGGGTVTVGEE